jgi:hypothetical protein
MASNVLIKFAPRTILSRYLSQIQRNHRSNSLPQVEGVIERVILTTMRNYSRAA